MATIGFKGFADNAEVAIEASQQGSSDSAAVPFWNATHEAQVAVTITRSNTRVAPDPVYLEVTRLTGFGVADYEAASHPNGDYAPALHELEFYWTFTGVSLTWASPQKIVSAHNDQTVGFGPTLSRIFNENGFWTVFVREPSTGRTAFASGTITVSDVDLAFAGATTYFVDPEEIYAGAPAGAVGYPTIATAFLAAQASGTAKRIMLRGGVTHQMPGLVRLRNTWPDILVTGAPEGGRPTVNITGTKRGFWVNDPANSYRVRDLMFSGIDFTGIWDATDETPKEPDGVIASLFDITDGASFDGALVLHECTTTGFDMTIAVQSTTAIPKLIAVSDSIITNWQDFGFLISADKIAFVGTRIQQHVDALSGGPKTGNDHNNHGPIRVERCNSMMVDSCDMFSRNGWVPNVYPFITTQPCLRFGTKTSNAYQNRLNFQRTSAEGGFDILLLQSANPSVALNQTINAVIERNLLVGTAITSRIITPTHTGITIRQNIMIRPDTAIENGIIFDLQSFITLPGEQGDKDGPIRLTNNTLINLQSGNGVGEILNQGGYMNAVAEHNLVYQPAASPANTTRWPLDVTEIWDAREKGYIPTLEVYDEGTLGQNVPNGGTITVSYSAGDATWFETDPDRNRVMINGVNQTAGSRVSYSFGTSSVTITNNTGATWPAGATVLVYLERAGAHPLPILPGTATPDGIVAFYAPLAGSNAIGAGASAYQRWDFFGADRRDILQVANRTTASLGAIEPAV